MVESLSLITQELLNIYWCILMLPIRVIPMYPLIGLYLEGFFQN